MPDPAGRLTAVAAVLVLLVGAAACGSDTDDRLPPPQSPGATTPEPTPTEELTPDEQEAFDTVRDLFDEFMEAYVEVATSDEMPQDHPHHSFLEQHRLYDGGHLRELFENWQDGHVFEGELRWSYVGIHRLELDHVNSVGDSNPQVWLRYCVDATDWTRIDQATGDRVGEPGQRTVWTVPAGYLSDEDAGGFGGWGLGWRDEDGPC